MIFFIVIVIVIKRNLRNTFLIGTIFYIHIQFYTTRIIIAVIKGYLKTIIGTSIIAQFQFYTAGIITLIQGYLKTIIRTSIIGTGVC